MIHYNKKLQARARVLRKNMTDAERMLWSKLCRKQLAGFQFYRQRIIENFIVDFYCPIVKLVIEVDGGQHYHGKVKSSDKIRDEALKNLGLKVLRFSDRDVLKNIDGVLEEVHINLTPPG
ncbi:MAG: DUF559 domain-containing protein [Candidatus Dadabacteria bacterium]|nr:DUF559 domain-containing protein [Candidatus Dadabacteria bacterium]